MGNFIQKGIFNGCIRKNEENPRYFTDNSGKAIYLTGSHHWETFQDISLKGVSSMNYSEFLETMKGYNHNFIRMWSWEQAAWAPWTKEKIEFDPLPYMRTGPGLALDGKPRFDLEQWNEEYFIRLRDRIIEAGNKGFYVSFKFFEGWSVKKEWLEPDPWPGHPYNRDNNINGIDGDMDRDGLAEIHTLRIPSVVEQQKRFVRKVIDTVNDLDNLLYEVINETKNDKDHLEWHYHMIDYIKEYQNTKSKQHMVGMTSFGYGQDNTELFRSNADWISPGLCAGHEEYKNDPPEADGSKIIISDTDHLWGHGGNYKWVWKSFLRGHHPIFMDPWYPIPGDTVPEGYPGEDLNRRDYPDWEPIRVNMGYTLKYAELMKLNGMIPCSSISSTGYCLANAGEEYLVYQPENGSITVDLTAAYGLFAVEWFNPCTGRTIAGNSITGGESVNFGNPFSGDAVLYLKKLQQMRKEE